MPYVIGLPHNRGGTRKSGTVILNFWKWKKHMKNLVCEKLSLQLNTVPSFTALQSMFDIRISLAFMHFLHPSLELSDVPN
jgi:hypothetical protein